MVSLQVSPSGAAGRDGRLRVGLRLLEVNQQSLLGLTHGEAVQLLRSVGDTLTVLVCDGFDTSAATPEVSARPAGAWPQELRPAPIVAGRVLVHQGQDVLGRCESDLGEPCGAGARPLFRPHSWPWWDRACVQKA